MAEIPEDSDNPNSPVTKVYKVTPQNPQPIDTSDNPDSVLKPVEVSLSFSIVISGFGFLYKTCKSTKFAKLFKKHMHRK